MRARAGSSHSQPSFIFTTSLFVRCEVLQDSTVKISHNQIKVLPQSVVSVYNDWDRACNTIHKGIQSFNNLIYHLIMLKEVPEKR